MAGLILPTKPLAAPDTLTTIVAAPAIGRARRVDLSACHTAAGATLAAADVYILDANAPNSGYRHKGYPVLPPPDPDCAVILESGLLLMAGQALQVRAGAADSIGFCAEVVEIDADATMLPTVQKVGTAALATLVTAPADGKVKKVDVRVSNVHAGGGHGAAYLYINHAGNSGYIRSAYPVPPPPSSDCSVNLAFQLLLTAGQALQIKADAVDKVAFSAEVGEYDA